MGGECNIEAGDSSSCAAKRDVGCRKGDTTTVEGVTLQASGRRTKGCRVSGEKVNTRERKVRTALSSAKCCASARRVVEGGDAR